MRAALVEELMALAEHDPSVMLLTGDLGYTVFEPFQSKFPDRYVNCGVAEANMMGVAAGLAREGFRPFVYSFIPFAIFRAFEQVRIDICYHELPVTITALGAGYSYGDMGATHHAIEDIAVARALPNLRVVCPGDPWEVRCAMHALMAAPSPAYLRLAKRGEPVVHVERPVSDFRLGQALVVQEGSDIALLATSNMLAATVEAARRLETMHGMRPTVASIHTIKPLDVAYLRKLSESSRAIFTIEEHSVLGGLGGAVAEALSDAAIRCPVYRIGIPDRFVHVSGSQDYYRKSCGLTPDGIVERVIGMKGAS